MLAGTQVGDDGIRKLDGLAKLRTVFVVNTHITPRRAEEFRQVLRNCEMSIEIMKRPRR
jgi:hypothetical protein